MYSQFATFPNPQTLSPYAGVEAMVESGYNHHHVRIDRMIFKGFFAGMLIANTSLLQSAVGGNSTQFLDLAPGIVRFYEGLVFPVGYALVYLLGMELLTWNVVTFGVAITRFEIAPWAWPINFFILFWANLVGAITFAAIFARYGAMSMTAVQSAWFTNRANFLAHWGWHNIMIRSIASEWLVASALLFAASASSLLSKLAGIWLAIATVGILQLGNLVSDFFFYSYAIMIGTDFSTAFYIGHILMPELIGTIIGSLILVGVWHYCYLSHPEPSLTPYYERQTRHHPAHTAGRHDVEAGAAGAAVGAGAAGMTQTGGRTTFPRLSLRKGNHHRDHEQQQAEQGTTPAVRSTGADTTRAHGEQQPMGAA